MFEILNILKAAGEFSQSKFEIKCKWIMERIAKCEHAVKCIHCSASVDGWTKKKKYFAFMCSTFTHIKHAVNHIQNAKWKTIN